jgi:phosphohistidine phosphatase
MRLYLLRHAIAAPRGTPGYRDDAKRPLTEEGHRQAQDVAVGFARLRPSVDAVLSSPYVRAMQTAEHLARAFKRRPPIRELRELLPEAAPQETAHALAGFAEAAHLVMVGHEPHLSAWLSWLTAGEEGVRCLFKKAGMASVELDVLPPQPRNGTLRWLLTPKQLTLIGKR